MAWKMLLELKNGTKLIQQQVEAFQVETLYGDPVSFLGLKDFLMGLTEISRALQQLKDDIMSHEYTEMLSQPFVEVRDGIQLLQDQVVAFQEKSLSWHVREEMKEKVEGFPVQGGTFKNVLFAQPVVFGDAVMLKSIPIVHEMVAGPPLFPEPVPVLSPEGEVSVVLHEHHSSLSCGACYIIYHVIFRDCRTLRSLRFV